MGPTLLWTCTAAFHIELPFTTTSNVPSTRNQNHPIYPSASLQRQYTALFSSSDSVSDTVNPPVTILNNTDRPIQRIFCLSDLHTDHVDNLQWLRDHAHHLTSQDLVIVAGDISHDRDTFRQTLRILRRQQSHVWFMVGNHEAWLHARHDAHIQGGSLQKFQELYDICHQEGVYADTALQIPIHQSNENSGVSNTTSCSNTTPPDKHDWSSSSSIWVIPLHSWYDGSLSFAEEYCQDFGKWPWVDFVKTQWNDTRFPIVTDPSALDYRMPRGLTNYLHHQQQAERDRLLVEDYHMSVTTDQIFTVSHFLPNPQCLPDFKDLDASEFDTQAWLDHGGAGVSAKFAKVAGTILLDQHIRRLVQVDAEGEDLLPHDHRSPRRYMPLHIFGHSHRPKDFVYKGIRYVHNPLGKPRERLLHMISPRVDFQLVWDQGRPVEASVPIIRYWEEQGGGVPKLKERLQRFQRRRASRYGRYQESSTVGQTQKTSSSHKKKQ